MTNACAARPDIALDLMFKAKTLMIDIVPTLLLAISTALVWRLDKRQHTGARLCQHAAASSRQLVAPMAPG